MRILVFIIIISFFISCSNEIKDEIARAERIEKVNDSLVGKNDMIVYSLPSPLQISTVVKLANLPYCDKIKKSTIDNKNFYPTDNAKALVLGIYNVDLGYELQYDKTKEAQIYLSNIEKLMTELELNAKGSIDNINKIKSNINNKDAVFKTILEMQQDIDEYFVSTQNQEIGLLIVSGMYIEGLYISAELYQRYIDNRKIDVKVQKYLNHTIAQQEIFLNNLIDLLIAYSPEKSKDLVKEFTVLKDMYKKLNISIVPNKDYPNQTTVKINIDEFWKIKQQISKIKNNVISNS